MRMSRGGVEVAAKGRLVAPVEGCRSLSAYLQGGAREKQSDEVERGARIERVGCANPASYCHCLHVVHVRARGIQVAESKVARGHVDRVHRGGAGPCSAVNVKAAPERQTRRRAVEWGGRLGLQNVTGCILSEGERDAQFCRVAVAVACSWISTVLLETGRAEPMVAREHDASSMPRTPPRPPSAGLAADREVGQGAGSRVAPPCARSVTAHLSGRTVQ